MRSPGPGDEAGVLTTDAQAALGRERANRIHQPEQGPLARGEGRVARRPLDRLASPEQLDLAGGEMRVVAAEGGEPDEQGEEHEESALHER